MGVERVIDQHLRLSYVLWEEKVMPIMALEVVSHKRRGEYKAKKQIYAEMKILYYVIYNPQRRKQTPLSVFKLVNNEYVPQLGNPVWLPEIGLAIGYEQGTYQGITRDWLYWYDAQGVRYLSPEERAIASEQRAQKLAAELQKLGIDPDSLN